MPTLDYCSTVWGGRYEFHDTALDKLLKRGARICLGCPYLTPSADMFESLKWLPYSKRLLYKKGVLVYKCLNSLSPNYMTDLFSHFDNNRVTRQNTNITLKVPLAKTKYLSEGFSITGAKMWNNLPAHLRVIDSVSVFKADLFKHLAQ